MRISKGYAIAFAFLFAVEVLIAIFMHDNFVRLYIGDMLVVILIYCFLKNSPFRKLPCLPLYIFIFAAVVEGLQYFNLVHLLHLEQNRIARIVIGTTFDVADIMCYFVGCLLLFIWQYLIEGRLSGLEREKKF